ncbi:Type IV secretion system protein PtlH [Orchesella cincta]|uniref:Type IV secretion system protein PtlH n=1 Tax=Orchesella cincta TaxID=48709 RepID=A0A1D2M273_ORCCI|nr:Type IV secretion system protein PtlH [Orchesella cincta]
MMFDKTLMQESTTFGTQQDKITPASYLELILELLGLSLSLGEYIKFLVTKHYMVMLLILKMKTQQLVFLCLVLFYDAGFAARDSRRSRSSPRKQCRILDAPSINVTSNTHPQPETLQEILNNGIHQMQLKDHDKTAILVMGNTGSGKTTLTQILSGNLSQLHAVMTHTHKLVIIDDNNRIGLPTTKSKTLVPEYVVNPENNISFYDCPGFDDNRGAEKDIAAMYFVNSITEHINKVKFLFVVTHSSVIPGNDRLNFDLLVTHASSKVNSFSEFGMRLDDDQILDGVVGFMRQYTVTLKEDLHHCRTDDPKREILSRKMQFVEALLDHDDDEDFPRIWFIRHVPECGTFSEIPYVAEKQNYQTLDLP